MLPSRNSNKPFPSAARTSGRVLRRLAPFADNMSKSIIKQITDGRTDLVFDFLAAGHAATSTDEDGTRLVKWCAYYGDVSAIRFLLANGESLQSLGDN